MIKIGKYVRIKEDRINEGKYAGVIGKIVEEYISFYIVELIPLSIGKDKIVVKSKMPNRICVFKDDIKFLDAWDTI